MTENQESGFPPRRTRHSHPKSKSSFSLMKVVRSGLVLFGALFFGLIGLELYQAKVANKPVVSVSRPVAADDASPITESVTGGGTQTGGTGTAIGSETSAMKVSQPNTPSASSMPSPQMTTQAASGSKQTDSARGSSNQTPANPPSAGSAASLPHPAKDTKDNQKTAAPKRKAIKHVVEKGETLYMLSRKYYGNNSGVSRIARYNGFSVETQLTAGKVVMIPISM